MLMCEPEIGQLGKMRWEVIWSGLGAVGIQKGMIKNFLSTTNNACLLQLICKMLHSLRKKTLKPSIIPQHSPSTLVHYF